MVHFKLYVGIDVGALCSGFALVAVKRETNGSLISIDSYESEQRPTIQYLPQTVAEQSKIVQCGPEFSKLSLVSEESWDNTTADQNVVEEVRRSLGAHDALHSGSTELVGQIIKAIWEEVKLKVGPILDKERRNKQRTPRINVKFTYPSMWPTSAQGRFKEAVAKAGLVNDKRFKVTYMTEGKAAGIAIMHDFHFNLEDLPAVVADCGGVTIDTVLLRPSASQETAVDEHNQQSKLYGVYSADLEYRCLLQSKVAEIQGNRMLGDRDFSGPINAALTEWRATTRNEFLPHSLLFRGRPRIEVDGTMVGVHRDEVVNCFDRVSRVIADMVISHLVNEPRQAGSRPKVFLTGGLSLNKVVRHQLQLLLRAGPNCEEVEIVSHPDKDKVLTTVCRGAALDALQTDEAA